MFISKCKQTRPLFLNKLVKIKDLEFVGFITLYTKTNVTCVQAFNLLSFALFKFSESLKTTKLHCLFTADELVGSTMSEQVIQIIQLIQMCRHNTYCITFPLMRSKNSSETMKAYKTMGVVVPWTASQELQKQN